jgi:restriction system protein
VAQVTVRTIHELFEADRESLVETIVFNGHVETTNAATGKSERPCLVTLRTTRETFLDRDFARLDAEACLLDLSASLSKALPSWFRSGPYWNSTWSTPASWRKPMCCQR